MSDYCNAKYYKINIYDKFFQDQHGQIIPDEYIGAEISRSTRNDAVDTAIPAGMTFFIAYD